MLIKNTLQKSAKKANKRIQSDKVLASALILSADAKRYE
jgi:hypothetical protein